MLLAIEHELHESHELFAVQDIVTHISEIREISGQSKHLMILCIEHELHE